MPAGTRTGLEKLRALRARTDGARSLPACSARPSPRASPDSATAGRPAADQVEPAAEDADDDAVGGRRAAAEAGRLGNAAETALVGRLPVREWEPEERRRRAMRPPPSARMSCILPPRRALL